MTTPNYNLLKDAYAILDGIPEEVINLDAIRMRKGESLNCGTIACGIGWLAMHPQFQRLGLGLREDGGLSLHGENIFYDDAAEQVFGLSQDQGEELFEPALRGPGEESHKEILLKRFRALLGDARQITNPAIQEQYEQDWRTS